MDNTFLLGWPRRWCHRSTKATIDVGGAATGAPWREYKSPELLNQVISAFGWVVVHRQTKGVKLNRNMIISGDLTNRNQIFNKNELQEHHEEAKA